MKMQLSIPNQCLVAIQQQIDWCFELQLDLHPNKVEIRAWGQGIDFLGYVLRPYTTTLRTKTKQRMMARANENNISSYLGLCSHADAYRVSQIVRLIAWNGAYSSQMITCRDGILGL